MLDGCRTGSGRTQLRLLNRQAVLRGVVGAANWTARGHNASAAATIAAASSSVGGGDTPTIRLLAPIEPAALAAPTSLTRPL